MEELLVSRWNDAFSALFEAVEKGRERQAHGRRTRVENGLKWALDAFAASGVEQWSAASRSVLGRYPYGEKLTYDRSWESNRVKCMRYGLAVVQGDVGAIPPHERPFLAAALGRLEWAQGFIRALELPPPRLPQLAFGADGVAVVEVAYRWPQRKRGKIAAGIARSSTSVRLISVGECEAPVAFLLSAPEGDVPFRRWGGDLYRPLLALGEWRWINVDEFAEALRTGQPWRDSPVGGCRSFRFFHDWASWCNVIPLADYAANTEPTNERERTAKAESERSVTTGLAGRLVAMDRTVYYRVDSPLFHVVHDSSYGGVPFLSWLSAGLCPEETQETLLSSEGRRHLFCRSMGEMAFPLTDVAFAADLVGRWRKALGEPAQSAPLVKFVSEAAPLPTPNVAVKVACEILSSIRFHEDSQRGLRGVAPGTPYNCPTAEELGLDRILPSLATGDPAAYVAASDSVRKAAALVPDEDDKHVERSKGLRARILLETLADWLPNMVPTWSREPDTIDDDDLSGFTI